MSEPTTVTGVTVYLGTNPAQISADVFEFNGVAQAMLQLGPELTIHATQASPEVLDAIAAAATELAAWKRVQTRPTVEAVRAA